MHFGEDVKFSMNGRMFRLVNASKLVMKLWLAGGLLCLCLQGPLFATTLYVAPNGNDRWSGNELELNPTLTDGPLATLQGARDALRRMRAKGSLTSPVKVLIAPGNYPLTETLIFTPEDSGTPQAPVVYQALKAERPVFNGGRSIRGFKREPDGTWSTRLPQGLHFEQLFVNGRRAVRARSPNQFYHYVQAKADAPAEEDLSRRAFRGLKEDLQPLYGLTPAQLQAVNVVVYDSWGVNRILVSRMDPTTNTLFISGTTFWPFLRWGSKQRYHLENFKAALDQMGEWFLDLDGTLYYKPLPDEDPAKVQVTAPVLEQFVRFAGTPAQRVAYLTLRGLSFQYGQYLLPPQGHDDAQAAHNLSAVILADGARAIALENCEIAHVGLYGIWFRKACSDCRVEHSSLYDLGGGGIRVGEGWVTPEPLLTEQTGGTILDNNILRGGGQIAFGAVGIWVGHSGDNRITHNDISDFRYTGVSVGWRWGYAPSLAQRNLVAFNHIHHLGWGVLSDLGGVYTLGPSAGTVIRNNVVHDIYSYDAYGRGGWGIYNDEGTSGVVVEDNLVYNTKTGGYHLNYGKNNLVRNNIFALSQDGQLQRSRDDGRFALTFHNNIVYWKQSSLFNGVWGSTNVRLDHNLYYQAPGVAKRFGSSQLAQWQQIGKDQSSLVADPLFVASERGDFRLRRQSPALKLGFKPFDYRQAGVYGAKAWRELARNVNYPPVQFAPAPR
jgi:Right handed beta helix region